MVQDTGALEAIRSAWTPRQVADAQQFLQALDAIQQYGGDGEIITQVNGGRVNRVDAVIKFLRKMIRR